MDLYATLPPVERKKVLEEKLRLAKLGVYMDLSDIVSAGVPMTTLHVPIQLELPLEWTRHATPEHLLKVLEPCTNQMQSQLSMKKR